MIHGEDNKTSKLKENQVLEIRRLYDEGVLPKEIAKKFSISRVHAMRVGKRQTWKHLPEI